MSEFKNKFFGLLGKFIIDLTTNTYTFKNFSPSAVHPKRQKSRVQF